MLDYAIQLTRDPHSVSQADVDRLRAAGLSDEQVSHAAQVISLFNYYNRIVDGLGAPPEPEW